MSKIEFTYKDENYVLEYDRASVVQAEKLLGVSFDSIRKMQMSAFPDLFRGAFLKNHPAIKPEVVDDIYDCLPNKPELFAELVEMYGRAVETLMAEPAKGKAIAWKKA